jgi:2-keto-4-pentenoate hydratase/2-oxohepta-3-ene-1,7-dioic acid hydratase in catechol pathway
MSAVRWVRYEDNGHPRYGMLTGDTVQPVNGDPFRGYDLAGADARPVAGLRWLPPVVPGTFYAAGLNYRRHAERAAYAGRSVGAGRPAGQSQVPTRAEIGYRANSALTGHLAAIVRPADCDEPLVAEGELVAIIGQMVPRHCTLDEAREAVLGWTIGNDVSARGWQKSDRTFWRSKNSDTFKPMGPYLVTGVDPLSGSTTTTISVDGTVRGSFPTGDMLFSPYDFITEMSRYITLNPGDVLWMGADETATVVPGQVVEITIDGLGTLANPVTEEKIA